MAGIGREGIAGRVRRMARRLLPPPAAGLRLVDAQPTVVPPEDLAEDLARAEEASGVDVDRWAWMDGVLFGRVRFSDSQARLAVVGMTLVVGDRGFRLAVPEGEGPIALSVALPGATPPKDLALHGRDGRVLLVRDVGGAISRRDPGHHVWHRFGQELRAIPAGCVLEVGSRARSGNVYRDLVPPHLDYLGVDVLDGPNVDVVADAHQLSSVLRAEGRPTDFVAAFSVATFEHLLMPWKCVVELNRVLRPGGLVFLGTHQTYPLHDEPWDFWRFSAHAWRGLFNRATGFEVVDAAMGEPASIVPHALHDGTWGLAEAPAYLTSAVLARKVAETDLDWPVDLAEVISEPYPF